MKAKAAKLVIIAVLIALLFIGIVVTPVNAADVELLTGYTQSTWGSGTSGSDDPYNTYYRDSRAQALYLASDLTAAGMDAGTITAIQLYCYQKHGRPNLKNFQIRMKLTSATTTTSWEGGWTTVYGPTDVTTTAGEWQTYDLSTTFDWDGTSNLMIDICRDDTAWLSGGGMYRRINVGSNRMFSGRSDIIDMCAQTSGTSTGSARNYLPSIKITYTPANQPPTTPTNIECNGGSCNITVDSNVAINCSGSTDADGDAITYFIEASLQNATVVENATDVSKVGEPGTQTNYSSRTCADTWGSSCVGCTNNVMDDCPTSPENACDTTEVIDTITINGTAFAPGDFINVTIQYDCYSADDEVSISYNNGSGWVNKVCFDCSGAGDNYIYSTTFQLDSNPGMHWVRASVNYNENICPFTCAKNYYDNDDVNFTVVGQEHQTKQTPRGQRTMMLTQITNQ